MARPRKADLPESSPAVNRTVDGMLAAPKPVPPIKLSGADQDYLIGAIALMKKADLAVHDAFIKRLEALGRDDNATDVDVERLICAYPLLLTCIVSTVVSRRRLGMVGIARYAHAVATYIPKAEPLPIGVEQAAKP